MRYTPLTHNNEFTRSYMRGKSYVHPYLVVYVVKNLARRTRVGLTATKKVGKAVKRNRARRVMRAALCQVMPYDVGSWDVILVARAQTPGLKSTQLEKTLRKLLTRAGLLEKNP